MHGASGPATFPVSRGERKRGRRKNFLVLLGLDKVVDVPVIFSDKFQQLFELFVFLDRMVDIPVVQQRQVLTVFSWSRCSSWAKSLDPVSCGKYSGTFVFAAPVAEPTVMLFTVPFSRLPVPSLPLQLS